MSKILNYLDFKKLIDINYLKQAPDTAFKFTVPVLIICAAAIIFGIILRIWFCPPKPKYKIDFAHFVSLWLIYPAAVLAGLVFFRLEGIPALNSRIIMLILALVWLYGIFWVVIYRLTRYRKEAREYKIAELKQKYLPKPRK